MQERRETILTIRRNGVCVVHCDGDSVGNQSQLIILGIVELGQFIREG